MPKNARMNARDPDSTLLDEEGHEHDDYLDRGEDAGEPPLAREPEGVADTLFGGSRFVFWSLGPLSAFVAISFFCTIDDLWSERGVSKLLFGICCLLFALALASPRRFGGAARGVTAIVFSACLLYLVDATLEYVRGNPQSTRPGAAALPNAIMAFLTFGLPSLWFTLRRRAPPMQR